MHSKRPASIHSVAATALVVLAYSISGCKSAAPPPDDTSLNTALQSKLIADAAITAEPIQTSVQAGVATLQGTVSSQAARALAASDASQVPGIKSIVNNLTVETAQSVTSPPVAVIAPPDPAPVRTVKPTPLVKRSIAPTPPPPAPIERETAPQQQAQAPPPPPILQPRPTPPPPPPAPRHITIPAGTTLPVRITQTLNSADAQPGDAFSGTLASDVMVEDVVAIPAGTAVSGKVDQVHEAGHFKGSALLTISLVSLNRKGESIPAPTDPYTQEGKGRGKNTAEKVGGGAAVGAILGGIFGGGSGAAIGAAAGGGLGAGAQAVTRGQQAQIPSETVVRFKLTNSLEVRASATHSADDDPGLQHHNSNN